MFTLLICDAVMLGCLWPRNYHAGFEFLSFLTFSVYCLRTAFIPHKNKIKTVVPVYAGKRNLTRIASVIKCNERKGKIADKIK